MSTKCFYVLSCLFTISLIVCVPGAWAGSSETFDAADLEQTQPGSQQREFPQAGSACSVDSDCLHNGTCSKRWDDWMACSCKNGTSGSHCETVDQCAKRPYRCGNESDVRCAYDAAREEAFCQCGDDTKEFDPSEKLCRTPCEGRKQCDPNGHCNFYKRTVRGFYFCECYEGSRGDRCEIVEQCENGEVDCGVDSGARCSVGEDDPRAFCKCIVTGQGFDYEVKKCKDCDCRENSYGCEFRDGKQICDCKIGYFDNGSRCEECKCGKGGSSSCKGEDGRMVCDCFTGYSQSLNQCELCDCGPTAANCTFDDTGKKQCACKSGSVVKKNYCIQMCNSEQRCQNGGTCKGVCQCPEGTSGDFCETVDWCANHRCGVYEGTTCHYNKTSKEGYCGCKNPKYLYSDKHRRCFVCDCGDHGQCIVVEDGNECICEEGYAENNLKCEACDCGYGSVSCSFDDYRQKLCQCKERFAQKKASTSGWSRKDDTCGACDCGEHGRCSFNGDSKVCDCEIDFREFEGECKECYCGPDGYCDFDEGGGKVCHCDYGYTMSPFTGSCTVCNCDPLEFRGIGTKCSVSSGRKECDCPDGFEERFGHCEDIDECAFRSCPGGTNCVNLPGTYRCECKKGFEPMGYDQDPHKYGCKDRNECVEDSACLSHTTRCQNSQGDYNCVCQDGYYPISASGGPHYSPKYVTCYEEQTQWYVASIILGILLATVILSLSCYICSKKMEST